jgi:hypothetical protein
VVGLPQPHPLTGLDRQNGRTSDPDVQRAIPLQEKGRGCVNKRSDFGDKK